MATKVQMTLKELENIERLKWYRLNEITHNLQDYTIQERRTAQREWTLARRALENYGR